MSPPYRLIDDATGQVATGPHGEKWEGMDIPVGNKMELYDTSATGGAPWQRVSPSEIVRPPDGGEPPPIIVPPDPPIEPPPINPLPPSGEGMDYPTNEQQLRECLLGYAASTYVGMLDPRTNVEISSPIVIQAPGSGVPWGVNGNYAKITYRGSGDDLLRIEGTQGINNRGLTIRNLVLDGGDGGNMSGGGAAACLRVSAPLGDNGPIYKFTLGELYCSGAVSGLILEGGVYEGEVHTIHVENCTGDGIILRHLPASDTAKGPVVSNIKFYHINSSRNFGCGIRSVYSVFIYGASFVLNGGGGIVAPDGLRGAFGINGENSAGPNGCIVDIASNGYGSVVHIGEASSDGSTHCRRWDGSQWISVGSPTLYFAKVGAGVEILHAHCSYYGSGQNPMSVLAP